VTRRSTGIEITTDVFVLRQVTSGEADRIVTLLGRETGKISAVARGALRSHKRFGAALAPFVLGKAVLRELRASELCVLENLDVRRDFTSIASDPVRYAHASYAIELARELSPPRQVDPAIFDLLAELHEVVASTPPAADTLRAYELALLDAFGLRPALDRCLGCGATDPERLDAPGAVLDPAGGGLRCVVCAAGAQGKGVRPLPAAARQRLVLDQQLSPAEAAALPPLTGELAARAREALHALLATHLPGWPPRSLEFIAQLRGH
jgi:DNA repair protein RecO (recombination protein O)